MTPETFCEQFATFAEAPNGVAKLRELILQLAVQGKLGTQDVNDEPASSLFRSIRGNQKVTIPGEDAVGVRFDLPPQWMWLRLDQIAKWAIGAGFPKNFQGEMDQPILFCKVSDMNRAGNERFIHTTQNSISEATAKALRAKAHTAGTVVFPKIGGAIATNKRRIIVAPTAIDNNCLGLTPDGLCESDWLYLLLRSIDLSEFQSGTSVPALSQGVIGSILVGLPPLAEQRRIVGKVDQLLGLCDELAARQAARREARSALVGATLDRLVSARSAAEFPVHAHRLRDHFDRLFDTPTTLPQLRQAILQLAVQGQLVPQDPNDEPAVTLIARIAKKLTAQNEVMRGKRNGSASDESTHLQPHDLPSSWCWARFDQVATIASNLVPPKDFADLPHVAPDNIEKGTGRLLPYQTVAEDDVRSANHRFYTGQILYSKIRPNLSKATIVDFDGLCSADMYPINSHIDPGFLLRFILSRTFLSMAVRNDTRVAMPKINQEELNRILVAVPPLSEQKWIVSKVTELLSLCDALEAKLTQAESASTQLLSAAVAHLLDDRCVQPHG